MFEINSVMDFENHFLDNLDEKLIVCIFSASWCQPCKNLKETMDRENIEYNFQRNTKFLYIDVDRNPDLSERFDIKSLPTQLFIKNNKVLDEIVGFNYTGFMKRLNTFSRNQSF